MTNLTAEKEQQILDALAAKFALIAENVITDDSTFDSEQDVIDAITKKNVDDELEVRYCKIDFLNFKDSETDGCDDMPVVFLTYNAHLFFGYKEKRSDASTAQRDAKTCFINLRNKFLEFNRTIMEGVEHEPLKQRTDFILGNDELTGNYGYSIDLTVRVACE